LKEDFHEGMRIYRFRSVSLPKYKNLIRIGFPYKREIDAIIKREKIDVVHVMVPTPAAITSIKVAKENKIKIVSHSHTQPENIVMHFPKFMRFNIFKKLFYKYIISIYEKTDIHICPSKFAEKCLKGQNIDFKTFVISNGVDLNKFKRVNPDSFLKKYDIPKKNKFILYVGRLDPEKCVDILIKSTKFILNNTKDFTIGIIGGGGLRKKLEELSIKSSFEKKIKFLGNVSDDDLIKAYSCADVFVLPSLAELEGMVVLEAMACGKPLVIANSKDSASTEFVNGNGFLFQPNNPEDLAEKIIQILSNDALRKKMSKKSYENSEEYSITNSVDKLEKVYYSLKNKK